MGEEVASRESPVVERPKVRGSADVCSESLGRDGTVGGDEDEGVDEGGEGGRWEGGMGTTSMTEGEMGNEIVNR